MTKMTDVHAGDLLTFNSHRNVERYGPGAVVTAVRRGRTTDPLRTFVELETADGQHLAWSLDTVRRACEVELRAGR